MKQIHKQLCYSLAAVVVMLGLAVVPASADHQKGELSGSNAIGTPPMSGPQDESGSRHGGDGSGTGSSSGPNSGSHTENEAENESATDDSSHQSGALHSEAEHLLAQERQSGKEHSAAERQKACEQRQRSIDRRTNRFATQAAKHLGTFNSIFTKLQTFHDTKGLTVANYDALVADATAKQASAQSAVDALKALDVNIDCSQSDPAGTVATIKAAVSSAHTALQDYRTSLKNLVVALKSALNASDNTRSSGGTQE